MEIKTNGILLYLLKVTTWDWTRAEKTFSVYEIMCKILKVWSISSEDFHGFSSTKSGSGLSGSYKKWCIDIKENTR